METRPLLMTIALSTVSAFSTGIASADDIDGFNNSQTGKSLAIQRELDKTTPFSVANIIGSHNSYNSEVYSSATSYVDAQHKYSIYDQLRLGARFIELDTHWTFRTDGWPWEWGNDLLLCHGTDNHIGCSPTDRHLSEGLAEVSNWLNANPQQVIILYIEDHVDDEYDELWSTLNSALGSKLYASGSCRAIPVSLSPAQVLAAGKQVVLWKDGNCASGTLNSVAFSSLGSINRVWEDRTSTTAMVDFFTDGEADYLSASDIAQIFADGGNLVNLDDMTWDDGRLSGAIWSWENGEPNNYDGNQDCAVMRDGGRWDDSQCSRSYFFACRNGSNWAISQYQDVWANGAAACAQLGDSYVFAAPRNAQENVALNNVCGGISHVWLKANDINQEGRWVRN